VRVLGARVSVRVLGLSVLGACVRVLGAFVGVRVRVMYRNNPAKPKIGRLSVFCGFCVGSYGFCVYALVRGSMLCCVKTTVWKHNVAEKPLG
jgi:hypothetical protein